MNPARLPIPPLRLLGLFEFPRTVGLVDDGRPVRRWECLTGKRPGTDFGVGKTETTLKSVQHSRSISTNGTICKPDGDVGDVSRPSVRCGSVTVAKTLVYSLVFRTSNGSHCRSRDIRQLRTSSVPSTSERPVFVRLCRHEQSSSMPETRTTAYPPREAWRSPRPSGVSSAWSPAMTSLSCCRSDC